MGNDYREQDQTDHHKTHRKPFFSFFFKSEFAFLISSNNTDWWKAKKWIFNLFSIFRTLNLEQSTWRPTSKLNFSCGKELFRFHHG